ncbi:helix-turn-helix domain-containing protein [Streptomyces sp. NPDC002262]|uniref:SEL1-like repeat protein n=1 Tax=Streptomyces sp. NPDC002262 TaxID=3154414 RepID=UPI003324FFC0
MSNKRGEGTRRVGDRSRERDAALAEMRRRLANGLARARLTKVQLAARTGLGRTTVQQAFNANAPVPSADTVAALALALDLPLTELLDLRRTAAGETREPQEPGHALGKPIRDWNPHDLEVHPAGPETDDRHVPALSGYVSRAHDRMLAGAVNAAMNGHSRMMVLVGASSTGKTRACWEAVQPLAAKEWQLWHPFNPTRAEAARDALAQVGPRTVVWLNEAQHYLGDPTQGEPIAAAVHALLTTPERGPVLVLGTLWPEHARRYTAPQAPGSPDPHSQVREILAGRLVTVPDSFDEKALKDASKLAEAGDSLLADSLTRSRNSGRVAQDLAGAPELLHRYRTASPGAKAVLEAAMDARRLGVGLHLPQKFLTDAAIDYLSDDDYDSIQQLAGWEQQAFSELAEPVHGKHAPLRPAASRPKSRPPGSRRTLPVEEEAGQALRLADYLEQHGLKTRHRLCPPASFWNAAHTHISRTDDLMSLSKAAKDRYRLEWGHHLHQRAINSESPVSEIRGDNSELPEGENTNDASDALFASGIARSKSGDASGAEQLFQQAADAGHIRSLGVLALLKEEAGQHQVAVTLARRAAEAGYPKPLRLLAERRDKAGDRTGAEALARQLAEAGHPGALWLMVEQRERNGESANADALVQQLADAGYVDAPRLLDEQRADLDESASAEALAQAGADDDQRADGSHPNTVPAQQAVEEGRPVSPYSQAVLRLRAGDTKGAEDLLRLAVDAGDADALWVLVLLQERSGNHLSAEELARQSAAAGRPQTLRNLAVLRAKAGDVASAEILFRQAADAGYPYALSDLARWLDETGDRAGAEAVSRRATEVVGSPDGLRALARWREWNGDEKRAVSMYRKAAEAGDSYALMDHAALCEKAGRHSEAAELYRAAADAGSAEALRVLISRQEAQGNSQDVEALYREVADTGRSWLFRLELEARWPHGLDADGIPSESWK